MKEIYLFLVITVLLFSIKTIAQDFTVETFTDNTSGTDISFVELDTSNDTLEIFQGDAPQDVTKCYIFSLGDWIPAETLNISLRVDGRHDFLDYDGDGELDVVTMSRFSGINIFRNDGANGFSIVYTDPTPYKVGSIGIIDYNNDGFEDVFFTGNIATTGINQQNGVLINDFETDSDNNSSSVFIPISTTIPAIHFGDIAIGNVVGSDLKDLIVTGDAEDIGAYGAVWENNGDGTFSESFLFDGVGLSMVAISNNGDNSLNHFVVSGSGESGTLTTFYENIGGGNFNPKSSSLTGLPDLRFGDILFQDFNSDEIMDIAISGIGGSELYTGIHIGIDSSTFNSEPITFIDQETNQVIALDNSSLDAKDYNGDGLIDLVVNGNDFGNTKRTYVITQNSVSLVTVYEDNDANGGPDGFGDPNISQEVPSNNIPNGFVLNNTDNCPEIHNPQQENNDGDTEGDICDLDDDNDGFSDEEELACGSDPFNEEETCDTLGLNDFNQSTVSIYPNPIENILNIKNTSSQIITDIRLYSLEGRLLFTKTSPTEYIDLNAFSTGIYLIKITINNTIVTRKLIKR
ncbi:hypothetical protein GCM10011344_27190 [Dokdonia pacifica]|uniref:Por secretion system C-terminal sorting domain-containing protein n=1 Tax=Dokdonia pacifica TaxID=1627892 RepID=A0A239E654_9FLAO|nr:T9SS type A sorting domain-containing protein [Dokdonia pacifica]GGG25088.1 hypothetical protein GCM10011344_27190 [Dokdonia pacifica]SNS40136.1 Por secretion system C-terminal sorting domain-containing protein [Dokdonia pacifica]